MKKAECPVCGCEEFYVKNPEDEYEIYEFTCEDGKICFEITVDSANKPEIEDQTETYCNRCSWHDKFEILKK